MVNDIFEIRGIKMIKIGICDDEKIVIRVLKK